MPVPTTQTHMRYTTTLKAGNPSSQPPQPHLLSFAEPLCHRPLFCVFGARVPGLRQRGAQHRHGDDFRNLYDAVGMWVQKKEKKTGDLGKTIGFPTSHISERGLRNFALLILHYTFYFFGRIFLQPPFVLHLFAIHVSCLVNSCVLATRKPPLTFDPDARRTAFLYDLPIWHCVTREPPLLNFDRFKLLIHVRLYYTIYLY